MPQEPSYNPFSGKKKIPHYYGDSIRILFIISAIIYAVVMPLWGNLLPIDTASGIIVILIFVILAGLTGPRNIALMFLNVLVAGTGVYLMQSAAIKYYGVDSPILFILRECIAILLLFAFYHAIRSARNMMLGKVGEKGSEDEFKKNK